MRPEATPSFEGWEQPIRFGPQRFGTTEGVVSVSPAGQRALLERVVVIDGQRRVSAYAGDQIIQALKRRELIGSNNELTDVAEQIVTLLQRERAASTSNQTRQEG